MKKRWEKEYDRVFKGTVLWREHKQFIKELLGRRETTAAVKKERYIIEESHKYPGCYNIYNKQSCLRVKYFAENDNKNYKRAKDWVKKNEQETNLKKSNRKSREKWL